MKKAAFAYALMGGQRDARPARMKSNAVRLLASTAAVNRFTSTSASGCAVKEVHQ